MRVWSCMYIYIDTTSGWQLVNIYHITPSTWRTYDKCLQKKKNTVGLTVIALKTGYPHPTGYISYRIYTQSLWSYQNGHGQGLRVYYDRQKLLTHTSGPQQTSSGSASSPGTSINKAQLRKSTVIPDQFWADGWNSFLTHQNRSPKITLPPRGLVSWPRLVHVNLGTPVMKQNLRGTLRRTLQLRHQRAWTQKG